MFHCDRRLCLTITGHLLTVKGDGVFFLLLILVERRMIHWVFPVTWVVDCQEGILPLPWGKRVTEGTGMKRE